MKRSSTKHMGFWNVLRALPQESHAVAYFTKVRWQHGEFCPYCKHDRIYHLNDRKTHKCAECKRTFSITVGTIFEGTKLPLQVWILAIAYLCENGGVVGGTELTKHFRITQKTAWHLLERLRQAALTISFQQPPPSEKPIRSRNELRGGYHASKGDPSFRWRNAAAKMNSDASRRRASTATPDYLARSARHWLQSRGKRPLLQSGDAFEHEEVEGVLQKLHNARGLAGGMGHPSDASRAEMLIGRLITRGYRIEPEACYYWALARRWETTDAMELASTVEGLNWEKP